MQSAEFTLDFPDHCDQAAQSAIHIANHCPAPPTDDPIEVVAFITLLAIGVAGKACMRTHPEALAQGHLEILRSVSTHLTLAIQSATPTTTSGATH